MNNQWACNALLAGLLFSGCAATPERDRGEFSATATGEASRDFVGASEYWCVDSPFRFCAVHLVAGDSSGATLTFSLVNGGRPAIATYPAQKGFDPSGSAMRVNYLGGKLDAFSEYEGESGQVVVTASDPKGLVGSFDVSAKSPSAPGQPAKTVRLQGTFRATCKLEGPRRYTCD